MAAATTVIRFGLQRARRKTCQDLSRATSFDRCSCRRQGSVDCLLGCGEVLAGKPSDGRGHPRAGPDVGAVGTGRGRPGVRRSG